MWHLRCVFPWNVPTNGFVIELATKYNGALHIDLCLGPPLNFWRLMQECKNNPNERKTKGGGRRPPFVFVGVGILGIIAFASQFCF